MPGDPPVDAGEPCRIFLRHGQIITNVLKIVNTNVFIFAYLAMSSLVETKKNPRWAGLVVTRWKSEGWLAHIAGWLTIKPNRVV